MIKYKRISISNFMSFGQQPIVVDLDTNNTRAILGVNEDVGEKGLSANGVGKTTILNGIIVAQFNEGIDKLKADEYINLANGKKMELILDFEKNGVDYRIRRCRKPNSLEFSVLQSDGKYQSLTLDAMRNTDDLIVETLGFNYDIFMSSFFLSPHRRSFMSMTGPEQRSLIEDMLGMETLAERAEALKLKRTNEVLVGLRVAERDLEHADATNERVQRRLVRLKEQWVEANEEVAEAIEVLSSRMEEFEGVDFGSLRAEFSQMLQTEKDIRKLAFEVADLQSDEVRLHQLVKQHRKDSEVLIAHQRSSEGFIARREEALAESRKIVNEASMSVDELGDLIDTLEHNRAEIGRRAHERLIVDQQIASIKQRLVGSSATVQDIKDEIAAHENGTCHVCGGDYTDAEKLEQLKTRLSSIEQLIERDTASLAEFVERDRVLNSLVFIEHTDAEEIEEKRREQRILENAVKTIEQGESTENPYTALIIEASEKVNSVSIGGVDGQISSILDEIEAKNTEIRGLEGSLQVYKELFGSIRVSKIEHVDALEQEVTQASSKLQALKTKENPFTAEIVEAESEFIEIEHIEELISDLKKKETHIGYLIKLLTDSKSFIRRRILDQYVPFLNKKLNEYAESLGLPHTCEINSDLSTDLTYMTKPVSYYNLSRGERLRLDMATTRAFRNTMAMLGKGCNIALLDEILDSALDASGIHSALKFVCDSAPTVLLITHREELSSTVDDKITVVKRNGFSDVIQ